MRKILFILCLPILFNSCGGDDESVVPADINLRQEMRDFVIGISQSAKATKASFVIIPQNGVELVSSNGEEDGPLNSSYLAAIDGHGQEDLFFGYVDDNQATPANDNIYLRAFLDRSKAEGNTILVTDYCSTPANMDASYSQNNTAGYISFAADERELNQIPVYPSPIYNENNATVTSLSQVKNFLYLINPDNFASKAAFISAVTATNYDLLIMDLFFSDGTEFTSAEINQLKDKANGGTRLVISYMSIGEAEDYRYYWQTGWNTSKPSWLDAVNPDWPGNYKVKYWEQDWQNIIYGNADSYLQRIMDADFDGVYLDIIDAFEYYE